ncbi:hypothetical protein RND71_036921 [Anisodus tanguticus]|uniref:Uncharacterized protein n=1 Tax=Anisodus tanguticus TaxID=243964 RepID=A0AAE1R4J9_9SOLA|nr:hypothetical protein RND71_036921 [Anisodus tanguticus]
MDGVSLGKESCRIRKTEKSLYFQMTIASSPLRGPCTKPNRPPPDQQWYRRRTKRSERPGAGKRVESIRLDDREKQNEIRIWPKKKQGYGYHDRSPSIKKNLSKSLRVSGAFKHPKYAGIENDIAF